MARKQKIPGLRRHKASSQGMVRLNRHDHWLGKWPEGQPEPAEVRARYDELIARWLASGRKPLDDRPGPGKAAAFAAGAEDVPQGLTVAEGLARYLSHARGYYVDADGRETTEVKEIIYSLRPVNFLCGTAAAAEFGPLRLKAVRELMIAGYEHPKYGPQKALARKLVNQRTGKIKRAFGWLVSEEVVPASVSHGLSSVQGLRANRSEARESPPVLPVDSALVAATLPFVPPHVSGILRLMAVTGCRPGEACAVTLGQIDRTGPTWAYRPCRHKGRWRGRARTVMIGPRGQQVLREFIRVRCPACGAEGRPPVIEERAGLCGTCAGEAERGGVHGPWPRVECQPPDRPLFGPRQQHEERSAQLRKKRKSKVQPSQKDRRKKDPAKPPGETYMARSLGHAVGEGCLKHGLGHWHPNQLRHTFGTEVRKGFGLEAAQVALGHAQAHVTQVYAERDLRLAAAVAAKVG